MSNKPSDAKKYIGMWHAETAANYRRSAALNRTPLDLTKDQLIQLYIMLYPFIAADFTHREDIYTWAEKQLDEMQKQIDDHNQKLTSHTHTGNMGSPTSPPLQDVTREAWNALPEDNDFKYGENLITKESPYSVSILHRNPEEDGQSIKRVKSVNISESYGDQEKFVPFDIGGESLDTNDADFGNDIDG